MAERVLVTGGAGFIGSHLSDELLRAGYQVRVLDSLSPQVHGDDAKRPDYLDEDVELMIGDVRDPADCARALNGVDAVYHLAAAVGVGQSMYEIAQYTSLNNTGTAVVLEQVVQRRDQIRAFVVASSMSLYGEGLYQNAAGQTCLGVDRPAAQLAVRDWSVKNADGETLTPVPTPETKPPALASIYALSKYDQEMMSLIVGQAYNIPTVAMRFFNVFGTRQALSNPYTGVLAIFASRLLNGRAPMVFEDGQQRRDFVSVYDIAQACRLAIEVPEAAGQAFNVGSGRSFSVCEVAEKVAAAVGKPELMPELSGKSRVGDIRHCFADISKARRVLGYAPKVTFEDGLAEIAEWLEGQTAIDRVDTATAELSRRGLAI